MTTTAGNKWYMMYAYNCPKCDVEGRTPDDPPTCWNCGEGEPTIRVTAKPCFNESQERMR